jgi:hypothetical protein
MIFLGGGAVVIACFYQPIIHLWAGKTLTMTSTVIASCIWMVLYGVINCFSILLNALNQIKRQIFFLIIGAMINVSLFYPLKQLFEVVGIIIAGIIALIPLLCSNVLEVLSLRYQLNKVQN